MAGLFCGGSGYLCTIASGTNEAPIEEPEMPPPARNLAEEVAEVVEIMEAVPRSDMEVEVEMMEEMPRSLNPKMSMHRLA